MAGNWNNSKENQTRWIFKDAMVEDLIETLVASEIEYGNTKGRGFDFEVGLSNCIQNYVRQCQRNNIRFFPRFQLYSLLLAVLHLTSKRHNETDHKRKIETPACLM